MMKTAMKTCRCTVFLSSKKVLKNPTRREKAWPTLELKKSQGKNKQKSEQTTLYGCQMSSGPRKEEQKGRL